METLNTIQIIPITPTQSLVLSGDLTEKMNKYGRVGLQGAVDTQRAYQADLRDFNG